MHRNDVFSLYEPFGKTCGKRPGRETAAGSFGCPRGMRSLGPTKERRSENRFDTIQELKMSIKIVSKRGGV